MPSEGCSYLEVAVPGPELLLDFDPDGYLIGIEFLGPTRQLRPEASGAPRIRNGDRPSPPRLGSRGPRWTRGECGGAEPKAAGTQLLALYDTATIAAHCTATPTPRRSPRDAADRLIVSWG
jgi:hypothetical protein